MPKATKTRVELEAAIVAKSHVAAHLDDPLEYEFEHAALNDLLDLWERIPKPRKASA